jgi:hypothetical protein
MALETVHAGALYRNRSTQGVYLVTAIALHSETKEEMVIYRPSNDFTAKKPWVRPLNLFKQKFEELK